MVVNQRDLVLLQYPFSDLKSSKLRPALIVSNDSFNKKSSDCIMVPLTTVIKDEPYSIMIDKQDLSSGKLLKLSRIRVDKIFSIDKGLISMKIGIIQEKTFKKVKEEIGKMF